MKIEVFIHRESIIHSMVEFCDGSTLAQLGFPDMRIPISYCLGWPERLELELPSLDLTKIGSLNFTSVEPTRYPCLELAIDAARMDRSVPAVLNGANEAVVESYLKGHLHFVEIAKLLQDVMSGYQSISQKPDCPSYLRDIQTLEDAVKADQWGRGKPSKGCRKALLPEKLIFPPVLLCHIGISLIFIFINLIKQTLFITKILPDTLNKTIKRLEYFRC